MKRYLSVMALAARGSLYKLLGVFFLMTAAEGAIWMTVPENEMNKFSDFCQSSWVALIFALGFLAVMFILCISACDYSSKSSYTLRRLLVSEPAIYICRTIYNIVCLLALWALQSAIFWLLARLWASPDVVTPQKILMQFYNIPLAHNLLPLAETSKYVSNAILVFSLAVTAASFSTQQRMGRKGFAVIILEAIAVVFFRREISFLADLTLSIVSVFIAGCSVLNVWSVRGELNEDAKD